jgi:hypothetical protein
MDNMARILLRIRADAADAYTTLLDFFIGFDMDEGDPLIGDALDTIHERLGQLKARPEDIDEREIALLFGEDTPPPDGHWNGVPDAEREP